MKYIINRNKMHIYQTKLKHNGGEIFDGKDISNQFNDFFINNSPTLHNSQYLYCLPTYKLYDTRKYTINILLTY